MLQATLLVAAAGGRVVLLDAGDCRDVLAASGRHLPRAVHAHVTSGTGSARVARLDAAACRAVLSASRVPLAPEGKNGGVQ